MLGIDALITTLQEAPFERLFDDLVCP